MENLAPTNSSTPLNLAPSSSGTLYIWFLSIHFSIPLLFIKKTGCCFHGTVIHGADIHGAGIHGAIFHGAVFHGAIFHGTNNSLEPEL